MKKTYHLLFLFFFVLTGNYGNAQDTLRVGLNDAVQYALEHNANTYKAQNEVFKARRKVWETTAMGFPQINGSVSYQKMLEKPVQMMPARIFNPQAPADQYIPVSFGTDQSAKWAVQLNQLIFNGSYIVGLYSSRTYKKISENALVKTRQKVRELTVQAYGNALFQDEFLRIMDDNIQVVEQNLFEIRQMYRNGLVEQTDVEQLELTLASLRNQRDYLEKMRQTAYEMLNFVLGRDPDAPLQLTDSLQDIIDASKDLKLLDASFDPTQTIDYRIAQNKVKAGKLQVRFRQSQFLPQIVGFVTYGKNAYNNDFTFFDKDQAWYEQSILGVSINIPLFSGLQRMKKVGQARLDYLNAQKDLETQTRQLQITYQRLRNDYEHSIRQLETARQNLALAEKIERKERIKYKEGVGNSFQLNQARMQLYQMQQKYLQSVLDLLTKKTQLENLLGINN